MTSVISPFLIILPINKILAKRNAGGDQHHFNKSNNNTLIRPWCFELINKLLESGLFTVIIYSYMDWHNHKCIMDKILKNLSSDKIYTFYGSSTKEKKETMDNTAYYMLKNKALLINHVNLKLNSKYHVHNPYNFNNTLIIDYDLHNLVSSEINSSFIIPPYDLDSDDQVLKNIINIVNSINKVINYQQITNIAEYFRTSNLVSQIINHPIKPESSA